MKTLFLGICQKMVVNQWSSLSDRKGVRELPRPVQGQVSAPQKVNN